MRKSKSSIDQLQYRVNAAAIDVHRSLGPGLLESVYHRCLEHELLARNIFFKSEFSLKIDYKDFQLDAKLRCDLLVEEVLVVELKAIDYLLPIHEAQLLTYMHLLKCPKGVIYNFNVVNLYHQGQKTMVIEMFRALPP